MNLNKKDVINMNKKIFEKCRIAILTIAIVGMIVPIASLTTQVKADEIDGVKLVAYNYDISMDKDGDGLIEANGDDNIRIEWRHDYDGETYLKVNGNPKQTLYASSGLESKEFCGSAVTKYFKTGVNTIKIWHGSNKGYSELEVNLPIDVDDIGDGLEFTEKPDARSITLFTLVKQFLNRFPIIETLFGM